MSIQQRSYTDEEVAAIDHRIELFFRFVREVLDDPDRLEQLPESAVLIALDPDDPRYNADRLEDARNGIARERVTYAWRLNAADPDHAAFPVLPNGDES